MADYDNDPNMGLPDKRRNSRTQTASTFSSPANYMSVSAMRARLAAINGTYWTPARMNAYTKNDLQYALRLADDAASF